MNKSRLEAFSDGVLAIIITIMVLELRVPHDPTLAGLWPLWPKLLSYALSFLYVGIYWNNHHHLWQAVERVDGRVLWANLHLLFWLSLVPFGTAWMGENHFAAAPVGLYGVLLLANHAPDSLLARALGRDFKGRISLLIYAVAIALAFWLPWLSGALYGLVAAIWLVPDRRFEQVLAVSVR